ncbi:MAG: RNA polymerase sigma factor RpoD/SigA [Weeksellaceae bacterium]
MNERRPLDIMSDLDPNIELDSTTLGLKDGSRHEILPKDDILALARIYQSVFSHVQYYLKKKESEEAGVPTSHGAILAQLNLPPDAFTEDEFANMLPAVRDGLDARNELTRTHYKLVVELAKKYRGRGLEFMDLIQEGNMGLMHAVDKFDPERGNNLSTYATNWIKQYINRAIYEKANSIRLPVHFAELLQRFRRVKGELMQKNDREPTDAEIQDELNVSADKMALLLRHEASVLSLDQSVDESNESTLGDMIADSSDLSPDRITEHLILSDEIKAALAYLTDREKEILVYRLGLGGDRVYTLEELGVHYGVTRERIRQIEAKALKKLRNPSLLRRFKEMS